MMQYTVMSSERYNTLPWETNKNLGSLDIETLLHKMVWRALNVFIVPLIDKYYHLP